MMIEYRCITPTAKWSGVPVTPHVPDVLQMYLPCESKNYFAQYVAPGIDGIHFYDNLARLLVNEVPILQLRNHFGSSNTCHMLIEKEQKKV